MLPRLDKDTLAKIPLSTKIEILKQYNDMDMFLTLEIYKEGEGVDQVRPVYLPGHCGMILLEKGRVGLEDYKLSEEMIHESFEALVEYMVKLEKIAEEQSEAGGREVSQLVLDKFKVLRESFEVLEGGE